MCDHYRKDQKVIEWAVRRGEPGRRGDLGSGRRGRPHAGGDPLGRVAVLREGQAAVPHERACTAPG